MQIRLRTLTQSLLTPVLCLSLVALAGCKNDDPPPPLPTSKPAPTPSTVTLEIEEIDAGGEEEDEPKRTGGTGRRAGPLTACCSALRQNAANLSEPSKGHMLTAAAACEAANGRGSPASAFLGTLSALLRGAPIPSACR